VSHNIKQQTHELSQKISGRVCKLPGFPGVLDITAAVIVDSSLVYRPDQHSLLVTSHGSCNQDFGSLQHRDTFQTALSQARSNIISTINHLK